MARQAQTFVVSAAVVVVVVALALGTGILRTPGSIVASPAATETGIVVTVAIAGGPPPVATRSWTRPVTVIVTSDAGMVGRWEATEGTPITIALAPGQYVVSAAYGNAGCSQTAIAVEAGKLSPFSVVCQIR